MTRDRATIAVVMFDGAPMFEMSVPISVFGVDRTANGAPRFNLLSVHGDPGVLTTTGGIQLKVPNGLEALQHAGIEGTVLRIFDDSIAHAVLRVAGLVFVAGDGRRAHRPPGRSGGRRSGRGPA